MAKYPAAASRKDGGVRVPVEQRVAGLEAQLKLLGAQVRQAQQLAVLGTTAMTMVHEVSNLLTPILGYAEAAVSVKDVALKNKALTVAIRNVRMAVAMADRILEIGAARSTKAQPVLVLEAVDSARLTLCRDLAKDGIRFVLKVDETLTAWADPLQLRQVFFNLFLNAREAMAHTHSGRLTVRAERKEDDVVIEVRDTGKGIPPDALPNVFDPLQSSKAAQPGGQQRCGGLGLALCRDLIEQFGGRISVESQVSVGTTFIIVLPAEAPAAE